MATPFLVLFSAGPPLLSDPLRQKMLLLWSRIRALAAGALGLLLCFFYQEGTTAVLALILITMHLLSPPRGLLSSTAGRIPAGPILYYFLYQPQNKDARRS